MKMDDICAWLNALAGRVERGELPLIPWAGYAGGRVRNPPAPHLEIIVMLRGQLPAVVVGGRRLRLRQGQVILTNMHFGAESQEVDESAQVWCMFFDTRAAVELAELHQRVVAAVMEADDLVALRRACDKVTQASRMPGAQPAGYPAGPVAYDPAQAHGPVPRLRLKAAVLELLAELLAQAGGGASDLTLHPAPVRQAIALMHRRYGDCRLSLAQLARAAGLSVDHFGRLFREATSLPPLGYLRQLRIEQARFLLTHTSLQVGQVAGEVGFKDPLHFSRVFRQLQGASPLAYRKTSGDGQSDGLWKVQPSPPP